ncbi:MAG: UPF0755 protein [Candidatus Berkelbacteria bacterium Licking1014_2]|uniref:Endolytic murein transglycosylase n=1 Tax=Candidatus Berkelbacteria bacterium Licking1014_2 TaxID=2017146 RepID=A0A554LWG8_9BACT|nr:MAG: UPF0755 protein [Candidatus Berkelbacteria bacterium Licking1014_2]
MVKKILVVTIIPLLIFGGGSLWLVTEMKKPACQIRQPADCQPVSFEVKGGETGWQIFDHLQSTGLIKNQSVGWLYGWLTGKNRRLQEGYYLFSPNQSPREIIAAIAAGQVAEYKITIPEGYSNRQIAAALTKKFAFSQDDFLAAAKEKEGYLFPDTYRFLINSQPQDIIKKMADNFAVRTQGLSLSKDDIILTSIVEKEGKTTEDKKIIAGIFLTRWKSNIPLESCATINYLLPQPKTHLSNSDIAIDSPYNTYRYPGLPPTPISNPGLESLTAVKNPTPTNYLFFLSDKDGKIYYSMTRAEHEEKKKKYLQ